MGSSAPKSNPGKIKTWRWTSFMAVWRNARASAALALSALGLHILTTLYAFRPEFITRYHVIGRSPSRGLFILRVLSELAALMAAATIATAFEKVRWMNMGHNGNKRGVPLADYIALEPGTGVSGLLQMAIGLRKSGFTSRTWSAIRLIATVIIPLLSVLIMSMTH
jgi:hypothetical protein